MEQIIPTKAHIKEAIDIFYIVNASGVNLTDAELALAQISGYWPEARDLLKAKLKELEKSGWVFRLDFLIYVLLGVIHNLGSKMEKLHTEDNLPTIKEVWSRLESNTLDYVFNIMKSQDAKCLSTGISIRKNMGKNYDLEWDHIFPYSVLKDNGYDMNSRIKYSLAQEVTNRAVLTQVANRTKSAKLAEGYLLEVQEKFPGALALQCIPEDTELWKLENYELFLEARRKLLAEALNEFLTNITETEYEDFHLDLHEMILNGENHHVEFKTTLRYDIREQRVNKQLENVILKTIAAFSNGQGGTLIMGVTDDMEIVGLDNDYNTLKEGTKDSFELHLRNLVNNVYGVDFAANNLIVSFPIIDEVEICVVEIKTGILPLYTKVKDKYGIESEKFYLRSGNSSPALETSEAVRYIRSRFDVFK